MSYSGQIRGFRCLIKFKFKVIDSLSGQAVNGAAFTLATANGDKVETKIIDGADWVRFTIPKDPNNRYNITITRTGYLDYTETIDLGSNKKFQETISIIPDDVWYAMSNLVPD